MQTVPSTVEAAIRVETRRLRVSTTWLIAGLAVLVLLSVAEPMVVAAACALGGIAGIRVVNRWLTRSAAVRASGWRRVRIEARSSGVWIGKRAEGIVRGIAEGQASETRRVAVWRGNGMALAADVDTRGWWSADGKTLVLDDHRLLRTR